MKHLIVVMLFLLALFFYQNSYTQKDLNIMKQHFLTGKEICTKRYDLNKDGKISLTDYVILKRLMLEEK